MTEPLDPIYLVIREWIERAEDDLKTAEYLLTMGKDCPYRVVCFHAQQYAEKWIKALLVYHEIEFPKIHDLVKIVRLVPRQEHIPLTAGEQIRLTDYATVSRYPGDREPPTRAEAEEAVALARKVREAVRAYLPPEAL